jgi:hypothetical protein
MSMRALAAALAAAAAITALTLPGTATAAAALPAAQARTQTALPWCDQTPECLNDEGNGLNVAVQPTGDGFTNYTTDATDSWDGYTVYEYVGSDGLCLGWNGVHTLHQSFVKASTCHNGQDQQFGMINGFWQNVGASIGTGSAYIVDSDYAEGEAEIDVKTAGSPNSHEEWIR